ncbi:MAG: amidophosphoribosyltransferase, partial [Desulfosarcina sp.]
MGGLFGVASASDCVADLYYGTDYHSHLGTRRGGMAVCNSSGIQRAIHNIENSYFRTKFESELNRFHGQFGIGVISDTDPQPLIVGSHLGTFGLVTVGKINNQEDLVRRAFQHKRFFSDTAAGEVHPTEVVAMLICEADTLVEGIKNAQAAVRGSCSMLLLSDRAIYAARDRLGRTPLTIGCRDGAYAVSSETCAFPNLGYEVDHCLGPGEIIQISPDAWQQRATPGNRMQVCAFLWVYYGYPASEYEGINVEDVRN